MAGVGRGKRRGWPAAQELDRMRARQVQRLAAPELEQRRARSVAAGPAEARADAGVAGGGGWPRGSPSNGRCGRGGSRERRWSEQGSKETAGGSGCELLRRAGDSRWQKLLHVMGMDEAHGSG